MNLRFAHFRASFLHGFCTKQTAVTHSGAESEIIPVEAGLRMGGLPARQYWECVLGNLTDSQASGNPEHQRDETRGSFDVDCVLANILDSSHLTKFFF